jgi:hypothetical protein
MKHDKSINIQLIKGDALTRQADLAFIGSGPALTNRIERESGASFTKFSYPDWMQKKYSGQLDVLKRAKILSSPNYIWKYVVTLGARPSHTPRRSYQIELIESMIVGVRHVVRPARVLFVPYHSMPQEVVILNTLSLIYLMMCCSFGKRQFFQPTHIEIADLVNPEAFCEFGFKDNVSTIRNFMKKYILKHICLADMPIEEIKPSFRFSLKQLTKPSTS